MILKGLDRGLHLLSQCVVPDEGGFGEEIKGCKSSPAGKCIPGIAMRVEKGFPGGMLCIKGVIHGF